MIVQEILEKKELKKIDLIKLLSTTDKNEIELIRQKAYETMKNYCGEKVFLRGLIEFSNYCVSDCYYCGIRKSVTDVSRYILNKEDVVQAAKWASDHNYGSVVLQSGERSDQQFIDYVCELVEAIKSSTVTETFPEGLGITLCIGEQTLENYKKLFSAGAHRYLLRIESSNPRLFSEIHPVEQNFERRLDCLHRIKEAGFQVGTGVMIGLPNQTIEDLADDILFFKQFDIDMIGMGPYLPHHSTPLHYAIDSSFFNPQTRYELALKMIAVTRLFLKDVNIASTTALQAINPIGREEGLTFGANVVMPQLTPTEVRKEYQLYDGKPCIDEFASDCHFCLTKRIETTGRQIGYGEWGDSKHFAARSGNEN